MSNIRSLPSHLRPRREKLFGDGRPRPLDREAKLRIMTRARALTHRTEKGKAYGQITAKTLKVLEALLYQFHNARSGLCFPSYEKIADAAKCCRSTVAEALVALEAAGLLTWVNRLVRIRERCADLFGRFGTRDRVIRTSNGYQFNDLNSLASKIFSSKSDFPSGTSNQDSCSLAVQPISSPDELTTEVEAALLNFQTALNSRMGQS